MKYIILILLSLLTLDASSSEEMKQKKQIGRMLVIGFENESVNKNSDIVKQIQKYDLGGVILFDKFYKDRSKTKNISSPAQLKELTSKLKEYSKQPLLISVDQEGGKVARLKDYYGFEKIPSAKKASLLSQKKVKSTYNKLAQMLEDNHINCNFAPVVDLDVNPKNKVISQLERSFGSSSKKVTEYAKIVIDAQTKHNVISVLKHFPGHGSSLGDSHKGFVDISNTWTKEELVPYQNLIDANNVDMIMSAHVFNSHLDAKYPATLSHKINTKLLREKMGFKGVLISDDLQMKAISKHYTLKQTVTKAINSGVDILLFGNQLVSNNVEELVNLIYSQVKSGAISKKRIKEANTRIQNLHTKNSIIQKPISFDKERIDMTKSYIKQHYALDVKNIKIQPKVIVLHWTAVMSFEKSFKRLKGNLLYGDRGDIAAAGALNVSSHFLVDRDGTIYQLMPDNFMARHVIGLNFSSIGVENIGGESNVKDDLTPQQLKSNIRLVKYLKAKYPNIDYLIGHHEYLEMENSPLWLERNPLYRTKKADPGERFMNIVRRSVKELGLKKP
ncbi:glycoside hydrolase family 3 N-terminal domain-containing protein [Sulfurimonas sp.]|uniref:glycoside hydrolase family 3 N-terminal domain-containing protein n=1 Tax=Sulfurimonas sp. TaxID=2022749 RepID=UPI0025DF2612|nr:glycoside hydrolase family 3 N-terminal domain-containing protein [Sulfurimonas sp.]